MAIPDFQTLMLPLMKLVADGKPQAMRDITQTLGEQFKLTDEEWKELIPSGRAPSFYNRVAWAKTHLKRAGLLSQPSRGEIVITERGKQILAGNPNRIDIKFLSKFLPEFNQPDAQVGKNEIVEDVVITPEEAIERAHADIRRELAEELLEKIKSCSPEYFENLVVQLLLKMGYGGSRQEAGKAVGKSGDGGIDGIINEDRLGLDAIYLQAKRYKEGSVGEGDVRDFKGALDAKNAQKGVFITTSSFTSSAVQAAQNSRSYKIILIDGQRLAELMIEHDLGVSVTATYQLKRIDSDFFEEE